MTGYEKVFLDTTPLIYFLDNDKTFGEKTKFIFKEIISKEKVMASSVVTCTEYLVRHYRVPNQEKIDVFFDFTSSYEIDLINISVESACLAAKIRASYKDFKAMDSLQLAVALSSHCDLFLTNDKQLRQFKELRCITVEDWILS